MLGCTDSQVTQTLVQEFHNTEMLLGKSEAKFMDRVKSVVKQINEHNISEKTKDNAITVVVNLAIQARMLLLYQLVDVHDMRLDKIYQQIVKNVTVKKKSKSPPDNAAASFISDDFSQYDDQNASIQ